jgi:hypothetical protein
VTAANGKKAGAISHDGQYQMIGKQLHDDELLSTPELADAAWKVQTLSDLNLTNNLSSRLIC